MPYASIGPIAVYLPPRIETNAQLAEEYPSWKMDVIAAKTGILQRHIADPDVCASDLGVEACQKLFTDFQIDPASIDMLLLCTQTPDYPLPTTACLMQERLGLNTSCGALDFNLGCSGFVYGLAMADGLIRNGACQRILLVTAETYSRYIDQADRSLRTIFGDGAAATLIEAHETPCLEAFQFGTDGSGADTLLVGTGGARCADQAIQPRHRKRWKSDLYMDGPSLMSFTVGQIPKLVDQILEKTNTPKESIHRFLFHQATRKMLEHLQVAMGVDDSRLPIRLERCGNTVSSTIPILINDLRLEGQLPAGSKNMLVGFGVGWSWAGCTWTERSVEPLSPAVQ